MGIDVNEQLLSLLYSLALGVVYGLIYDLLKMVRAVFNNKITILSLKNRLYCKKYPLIKQITEPKPNPKIYKVKLLFWDLLFFIIITPLTAIFTYATSYGIVRWYIFLGMSFGFIFYYVLLARLTKYIYEPIIYLLILLKQYLKLPFKAIFCKIKKSFALSRQKIHLKRENKRNIKRKQNRQELMSIGRKN